MAQGMAGDECQCAAGASVRNAIRRLAIVLRGQTRHVPGRYGWSAFLNRCGANDIQLLEAPGSLDMRSSAIVALLLLVFCLGGCAHVALESDAPLFGGGETVVV
jgi:hypothetical protein